MGKKEELKEIAKRTGKTALGYIPFVGPVLSELFDYGMSHFEQNKMQELFDKVEDKLAQHDQEIENIKTNEFGYSNFLKVARRWMEEPQKEKVSQYAECVRNGYLAKDINETKKLTFLNKLSEYTVEHLALLDYLSKDHYEGEKHSGGMIKKTVFPGTQSMFSAITRNLKQYATERDMLSNLIRKLERDGFIYFFTLDAVEDERKAQGKWTTSLGDEFLNYIRGEQNG